MENFELELTENNIKQTIINDYLDNNKKVYSLINLIDKIDNNINICIDGEWGCGKTVFINQFIYIIKNIEENIVEIPEGTIIQAKNIAQNNVIIYYDTWKNDNHSDAFQSLIYNILNQLQEYEELIKEFLATKEFIKSFFSRYLASNQSEFINFDNLSTYSDLAKDIVTEEEKQRDFKDLMKNILNQKRMILVIDELDRCNPIFACQILENIKHFYDLPNITIIVVTNNKELSNTIKKQYGDKFNSYGYLNKFYDFIITLDNSRNIEYAQKVLEFSSTTYLPHNIAFEMFKKYNFSYRECNRYRVMYEIVKKYIENDKNAIFDRREYTIAFDIILPIIISFKIKDIEAYQECLYGSTNSLKNALISIKDSFNTNFTHKDWLKELVGKEEDDEIKIILQIYTKFRKEGMYKELFNNCIRMNL